VLYLSLVPNFFHKVTQKQLRNLVSWSETMDLGIPCNLMTSLKYKSAISIASLVLLQGIKRDIFEKWSTTTKMESLFLRVCGKLIACQCTGIVV